MISAWSTRQNLVLGQAKVADKSNEIVALPKLLDLLTINGATVTIDAMGCQRNIAAKIIDKDADYILALKGNQGSLHDDTKLFFIEQIACGFADTVVSHHQTVEKSHGRIETRTTTAANEIAWLKERHHWPGPGSIVMVETVREIGIQPGAKVERETRFYIRRHRRQGRYPERRHPGPLEQRERAALGHGPALGHWVMDMVFRDDECRVRKNTAPANFAVVKHMASNLLRQAPGKDSLRVKRRIAAWDDDFLASLISR